MRRKSSRVQQVWSNCQQCNTVHVLKRLIVRVSRNKTVDLQDWSPLRWSLRTGRLSVWELHCVWFLVSGQTLCRSAAKALGSQQTALCHSHCREKSSSCNSPTTLCIWQVYQCLLTHWIQWLQSEKNLCLKLLMTSGRDSARISYLLNRAPT